MTAHKHAALLHAIADGDDMSQWECRVECDGDTVFDPVSGFLNGIAECPNDWEVRRKPKKQERKPSVCPNCKGGGMAWDADAYADKTCQQCHGTGRWTP